ncbi:CGNR zinc finger domain-containing protein [Rathayibacter soli]|uniref:CGNR zinc finger domain-containing protein n=1 Tax=Rathayibacter soli TaxID=3144168 RepID=UPI0027E41148|nr:CGNR zinc finger domain-containing protein [Glaciibacter superstes]
MLFAYDTNVMLNFMAALINTEPGASGSGEDELSTLDQLTELTERFGYAARTDHNAEELSAIRRVRTELRGFWGLDRDHAAERVNEILREERALPQLARHEGWDWHIHATPTGAPLVSQMRVEAAMALIDVIRANETERLRDCAADDCTAVLVDLSRNRSKRYCDVGNCGNRMNVNAYRARRASAQQRISRGR